MSLKKYLLAILTVAISLAASAQRTYSPKLWIGADGGMTMSKMEFSPSVKQTMLRGEKISFKLRYAEEKIFGLIGELTLEQRGWKEDYGDDNDKFNYQRKFTYVTVPVMTHIFFGSSRFKGFVNLGPSISFMIGDKISSNFDYKNPGSVEGFPSRYRRTEQMSMDVKNKFDYGIAAGAGIELFVGKDRKHSVSLEGRYYYGLGSIFPSHKSDTFTASRGSAITVSLGYWFRAFGPR